MESRYYRSKAIDTDALSIGGQSQTNSLLEENQNAEVTAAQVSSLWDTRTEHSDDSTSSSIFESSLEETFFSSTSGEPSIKGNAAIVSKSPTQRANNKTRIQKISQSKLVTEPQKTLSPKQTLKHQQQHKQQSQPKPAPKVVRLDPNTRLHHQRLRVVTPEKASTINTPTVATSCSSETSVASSSSSSPTPSALFLPTLSPQHGNIHIPQGYDDKYQTREGKSIIQNHHQHNYRHKQQLQNEHVPKQHQRPQPQAQPQQQYQEQQQQEQEQQPPSELQSLDWRMDPISSLSDWELQIFNRSTKIFETYHVHRVALAVGPRACGYFQKIFSAAASNTDKNKHNSNVTRVPLIAGACAYVADFLDFIYYKSNKTTKTLTTNNNINNYASTDHSHNRYQKQQQLLNSQFQSKRGQGFIITRASSVPLLFLSQFFQQKLLSKLVNDYIRHDIQTGDTLQHYYSDAIYYGQPDILDQVVAVASRVLLLRKDAYENVLDFLEEVSPEYFLSILEIMTENYDSGNKDNNGTVDDKTEVKRQHYVEGLASLIADYCILHQEELTLPIFEQMTHYLITTITMAPAALLSNAQTTNIQMDAKAAVVLLQMDLTFHEASELQTQCIHVLTEDWESLLRDLDPQTLKELLQRLSRTNKPIMMEWFHSTLTKAYQQLVETQKDRNASLHREEFSRDDLNRVVSERDRLQEDLNTMRTHFSMAKMEMKEQIQGWIRKHNQEQIERQAEQAKYDQERLLWQIERQQLQEEKAKLEYELAQACNMIEMRQGPHLADNTCSYISKASWDESSIMQGRDDLLFDNEA